MASGSKYVSLYVSPEMRNYLQRFEGISAGAYVRALIAKDFEEPMKKSEVTEYVKKARVISLGLNPSSVFPNRKKKPTPPIQEEREPEIIAAEPEIKVDEPDDDALEAKKNSRRIVFPSAI